MVHKLFRLSAELGKILSRPLATLGDLAYSKYVTVDLPSIGYMLRGLGTPPEVSYSKL
jgi:hypothetical protein